MLNEHVLLKKGNVEPFEAFLLAKAQAEYQRNHHDRGKWCRLGALYTTQEQKLKIHPIPEEWNEDLEAFDSENEVLPDIKRLTDHTEYNNLIRWGLKVKGTGNYRIIYVVHDYWKVILLHAFDKQYNGDIKSRDIKPAETVYETLLAFE